MPVVVVMIVVGGISGGDSSRSKLARDAYSPSCASRCLEHFMYLQFI